MPPDRDNARAGATLSHKLRPPASVAASMQMAGMPTRQCSVCGAALKRVETPTVTEHPLTGPHTAYVEERLTCVAGHTVLRLTNDSPPPLLAGGRRLPCEHRLPSLARGLFFLSQ